MHDAVRVSPHRRPQRVLIYDISRSRRTRRLRICKRSQAARK